MKKMFNKLSVYENILLSHFSEEGAPMRSLYNDEWKDVIKRFIDIYIAEDAEKETDLVGVIHILYANPQFKNRMELCRMLGVSCSTLKRLREKFCRTLEILVSMKRSGYYD